MARKKKQTPWADEHYDVTVWDFEGNIVEKLWDATGDEAEEVRDKYDGDPLLTVVVTEL